jgi:hypothetical protein
LRALSRPDKLCGGGKGREEGVCRLTFLNGEIEIEIGDWNLEIGLAGEKLRGLCPLGKAQKPPSGKDGPKEKWMASIEH